MNPLFFGEKIYVLWSFFEGAVFTLAFMMLGFFLSRTIKLTSLIDVLWPLSPTFMAYNLFLRIPFSWNSLIVLVCLTVWSLRLSFFLLCTRAIKKEEDLRYQEIIGKKSAKKETLTVLSQYLLQWSLQMCLSFSFLPFVWCLCDPVSPLTLVGVLLAFIGIYGEATADYQLLQFKKKS